MRQVDIFASRYPNSHVTCSSQFGTQFIRQFDTQRIKQLRTITFFFFSCFPGHNLYGWTLPPTGYLILNVSPSKIANISGERRPAKVLSYRQISIDEVLEASCATFEDPPSDHTGVVWCWLNLAWIQNVGSPQVINVEAAAGRLGMEDYRPPTSNITKCPTYQKF